MTAIEPKWLVDVAPQFFKVADVNKISKRKKQEKIEPLFNKYEKADEWRLSKVKRSARSVRRMLFNFRQQHLFTYLYRVRPLVETVLFTILYIINGDFGIGCT